MAEPNTVPSISIVIPVFNEEAILRAAILDLRDRLSFLPWSYEIVIAENGSTDRTLEIATELAAHFGELRYRHTIEPNYGKALREGIRWISSSVPKPWRGPWTAAPTSGGLVQW